jgi:hypothetical protein
MGTAMERTALAKPTRLGPTAGRLKPAAASQEHRAARWQRALGNRGVENLLKPRLHAKQTVEPPHKLAVGAHSGLVPGAAPERGRCLGSGRPLPQAVRVSFEPRLGWDFGGVRVHTGSAAAAAARRLRARAFTIGRDIVFGAGEYAPATTPGRALLAHELAHVVQQAPGRAAPQVSLTEAEREAGATAAARSHVPLSARPITVHRQPAPPGNTGITREEFARRLRAIFGHEVTIEVGNRARQTRELGGPQARRRLPDAWQAWDPGASAPLYDEILGAIEEFGREIGGLPDVGQIVFYDVRYVYDEEDNVVADTNAAAEFRSRGVMNVYRAALFPTPETASGSSSFGRSGVFLASGRSTTGRKGLTAPLDAPTRAQSQRRTVAHELGHGVEFRTGARQEFEQAVGWVRVGRELRLYDIQASGVKAAIAKGAEPPAAARITQDDWNSGAHREQPMSRYAVTSSAEDFADSIMAWLYARDTLKARSPARFKFFDDQARRRGWLPKLVTGGAPDAPGQERP